MTDVGRIRTITPDWQPRIPLAEGARQIVRRHDQDPARRVIDPETDALYDRLTAAARQAVRRVRGPRRVLRRPDCAG